MKTCCVIVTYGDRYKLISQVLIALKKQPVAHIIIVNNASKEDSRMQLEAFLQSFEIPSQIIDLDANEGSALGFSTGIQKACLTDCDFIWLLDDDNCPQQNSLSLLHNLWDTISDSNKKESTALLSNREDRKEFITAVNNQNPNLVVPPMDSFLGFHVSTVISKIKERLLSQKKVIETQKLGKVLVAPYGGLFFHKKLLEKNALPDQEYFLYLDDFDFTYKITANGGNIWMLVDSRIKDIEISDYLTTKKGILYHSIFDCSKDFITYYANRNLCYIQLKYFISNKFIYKSNQFLFYIFIILLGTVRGKFHRLKVLFWAIKDAQKHKMGKSSRFKI